MAFKPYLPGYKLILYWMDWREDSSGKPMKLEHLVQFRNQALAHIEQINSVCSNAMNALFQIEVKVNDLLNPVSTLPPILDVQCETDEIQNFDLELSLKYLVNKFKQKYSIHILLQFMNFGGTPISNHTSQLIFCRVRGMIDLLLKNERPKFITLRSICESDYCIIEIELDCQDQEYFNRINSHFSQFAKEVEQQNEEFFLTYTNGRGIFNLVIPRP